jgi:hypothetical protein
LSIPCRENIGLIDFWPAFPAGNFQRSVVYQAGDLFHFPEMDLIHLIAGLVIICMYSVKVKNNGDIVLCKVIMVAPVIEFIRVIGFIISIIQLKVN